MTEPASGATAIEHQAPCAEVPDDPAYVSVQRVGRQLITWGLCRPQCVAEVQPGRRCETTIGEFCGYIMVQISGTDSEVCAHESTLPDECFLRQRCPQHLNSDVKDMIQPEWDSFSPDKHQAAMWRSVITWTPSGISAPDDAMPGTHRMRRHHSLACPFGDHVPWAVPMAAALEDLDAGDLDKATYLRFQQENRAKWIDEFGRHLPEWAALLVPASVTPAVAERVPPQPEPAELPLPDGDIGVDTSTALYRYFDADDLLLYVGISDRLRARTGDHIRGSSWMDFAVRSTIERFPSRDAAEDAERVAITTEHPLFNHQHNDTPEARRRLVEYLLTHGRTDLLMPAVSRG